MYKKGVTTMTVSMETFNKIYTMSNSIDRFIMEASIAKINISSQLNQALYSADVGKSIDTLA